jgi:hypothetical protein
VPKFEKIWKNGDWVFGHFLFFLIRGKNKDLKTNEHKIWREV